MDDAELSELVRQFQALQKDSVPDQITERNVVEIVNTLIQKKMVDLLYTTDAKEYLTWDELKREVVEEVHANGGRINVVDVPGLLCVHTYHVERVLPDILASDPTLHLESGELMTDQYLEASVQAAAEALREHGTLSVAQFAVKHQFTSAFALKLLTDGIHDGRLSAVLQDAVLYTKLFVWSQSVILRSGLLAAEQPVDVEALFKRHNLFSPLMDILIRQVTDELPGSFQGHVYTPTVYEAFRAEQIDNIYASNGAIAYSVLQSMGIGNARQYLVGRYNPGAAGADGDADAHVSSSSASGGGRKGGARRRGGGRGGGASHSAASPAAPLVRADEVHPLCGYPLSSCFLADRHLIHLVGLGPFLEGEVLALDATQLFPLGVDMAKDWAPIAPRLYELYPALAECHLIEDVVLLRNDAEEKVKPQLIAALKEETPGTSKRLQKPGSDSSAAKAVIRRTVAKALNLQGDQHEAVLREVLDQWDCMIGEVLQQMETAKKNGASAELKRSRATLQTSLASLWVELSVVSKGLQWAKSQLGESSYLVLTRHTLATRGLAVCRDVILNESLDQPGLHAKVQEALEQATTPGNFKKCLTPFPEKAREALAPIAVALNEKELSPLLEVLQDMSGSGVVAVSSFHAPNKKVEREASARMKEALDSEVRASSFTDDATANGNLFAILVSLLVANLFRVYVEIPGKVVGAVVTRVAKEAEAPPDLTRALDMVTSSLQSGTVEPAQLAALEELRRAVVSS